MNLIYNLIVHIAWFHLKIAALFHPKIKLFVKGRKETFTILEKCIKKDDKVIWVHVSSLGEFEQGLPVIEKLKTEYPSHKILITFFSPSGYEVKKNTDAADCVVYLPIDTRANARKFISHVDPVLAIFVKYEIWPNFLNLLSKNKTPILLISAIFRKDQIFFKWYGGLLKKALGKFTHIFVQDENSVILLKNINLKNVTLGGDTRFDRVSEILEQGNSLAFMERFKGNTSCFVAGSTWPEDEKIIVPFVNETKKPLKVVIAPHNIKTDHIRSLKKSINRKVLLYSEINNKALSHYEVIIIDNIGLLTKIYGYADIAYVGGAFATGLHNTLEPAVFGIPILIGPDYKGFKEAESLVDKKGILVVENPEDFKKGMNELLQNQEFLKATGRINSDFVKENKGASVQIMAHIRRLL